MIDADLEAIPPPSGTLAITADVRGAEVAIDGKPYGPAPVVGELEAGSHVVRVVAEGYEPWQRVLAVGKDAKSFLSVELREREPEVTAAIRSAQRLGEAPASVSLVSGQELDAFDRETLADALRGVRGLYASDDGNYQAIGIRGFSRPGDYTNRVLVLRDGHVYNDDLIGSGFVGRDFAPDLDDVAQIEVVRGPGSAFYGQGAFFGVVNVVSLPAGEGPELSAGATVLSDGGTRAHARAALHLGDTALTLGVSAYGSAGQTLFFDEFQSTPSGGYARDDDGENAERVWLRLQRGRFFVDASFDRRERDVPTASFDTVFDPAHHAATGDVVENTVDERGTFEARWQPEHVLLRLYGDYSGYHGDYPYDSLERGTFVLHDRGTGWAGGGEARVTVAAPAWNRLSVGADVELHDIGVGVDSNGDGREDYKDHRDPVNLAVYAVDELALGERLHVTLGARVDHLGISDEDVFSPRIAAVAQPYAGGRTKLILGQAYRAPSDFEQYYADSGVTEVPSPPLEAEIIDTAEIEHTHELGRGSYLLAAVFASRIDHLIGLTENAAGKLVYLNSADEMTSVGAELEARKVWESGVWAQAAVSVTHISGGNLLARANSPPVVGFLKVLWPFIKEATLAGEVVVNGPRSDRVGGDTDAMVLVGVVASGRLAGRHLRWHVAVDNLLDWRYSVPVGDELVPLSIEQQGRRLRAGLSFEY